MSRKIAKQTINWHSFWIPVRERRIIRPVYTLSYIVDTLELRVIYDRGYFSIT